MHSRISNPCIRICLLKSDRSRSALRYTWLSDWLSYTTLASFWKTSLTSHVTAHTVCMQAHVQANLLVLSRTFSKRLTYADKRRRCPPLTSVTCRVKGLSVASLMTCYVLLTKPGQARVCLASRFPVHMDGYIYHVEYEYRS